MRVKTAAVSKPRPTQSLTITVWPLTPTRH